MLGEIYYREAKLREALQCFRQAALHDSRPYIVLRIARTLRELACFEEALNTLDAILKDDPDNIHFLREKALILNRMKDWDKSLETYERVLQLDHKDRFARRQIFRLKAMNRPEHTVIQELKKVMTLPSTKDDAHLHELLGQELREAGKLKEAAAEFRVARRLKPDNQYFLKQEGYCHYKLGDYSEATRILGQAFKKDPNDYFVRSALQKAYQHLQNPEGFITLLEETVEEHPGNMKLKGILKKLKKK